MKENVKRLRRENPEFEYHLYDDKMCRKFIKTHFDKDVVFAFDKLKPGAYKADLWRYCVLYIHGGIYLDIKMKCVNGFRLIHLTDKEYWVKDRIVQGKQGVWQGLISTKPKNKALKLAIDHLVNNVYEGFTGHSLEITGPLLMNKYIGPDKYDVLRFDMVNGESRIYSQMGLIISNYREYRKEYGKPSYNWMYRNCDLYYFPVLTAVETVDLSRTIQNDGVTFYTSTLSIVSTEKGILTNQRWVNYTYKPNGAKKEIPKRWISLNSRFWLDSSLRKIGEEVFLETPNIPAKAVGIEDIRLYCHRGDIHFISNRMARINHGIYPQTGEKLTSLEIDSNKPEKNWSYVEFDGRLSVVYQWYPLKIGTINSSGLSIFHTDHNMPHVFKHARGGTPGVRIHDEIWFVLHRSQNHEKNVYNYQHLFAVFDLNMRLKRYSESFKINGAKVEYCTGMIYDKGRLMLSYSVLDSQSFISIYDINNLSVRFYHVPIVDVVCGWLADGGITSEGGREINMRDNGELRYCLRSIRMYCPHIRTIHLILGRDCEPPDYINEHSNIRLIKESELYDDVQPNSETKKLFYGKIKGLSDYFLTFDDDFFLCKPLNLHDLIRRGKPIINSTGFFGRYQNDGEGHIPLMWKRNDYNRIIDKYLDKTFYLSLGTRRVNPFPEIKQNLVQKQLALRGTVHGADLWFHGGTLEAAIKRLKRCQGTIQNACFNEHLSRKSIEYQKELIKFNQELSQIFYQVPISNNKIIRQIFIYWDTGFNNAPILIKKCLDSWIHHNHNWKIIKLNNENIHEYINFDDLIKEKAITPTSFSDILRVKLLNKYGGCWCDATTLCRVPLDSWLPQYTEQGFFAFQKPAEERDISSWFLYSTPGNKIISEWELSVTRFVRQNKRVGFCNQSKTYNQWNSSEQKQHYFWLHYLFNDLVKYNSEFKNQFNLKPVFKEKGHSLNKNDFSRKTDEFIASVWAFKYPMYKMTYKHKVNYNSNAQFLLEH